MKLLLATIFAGLTLCQCAVENTTECAEYLLIAQNELSKHDYDAVEAYWAYITDKTDDNERKFYKTSEATENFLKKVDKQIGNYTNCSADLNRQFKKFAKIVSEDLPSDNYAKLMEVLPSMETNFAKILVCDYNNKIACDLSLESEIDEVMSTSRDPFELEHYWTQLYNKAGALARSSFETYVELSKKEAKVGNFSIGDEFWLDGYDENTFEDQMEAVIKAIEPLYKQLHGYVRYRLREFYGDDVVSEKGPLPMHLLGDIFAHDWSSIEDIVLPFPNTSSVDVSGEMVAQNYTVLKMYQETDKSFQLMGFEKLPEVFWNKSVLEKPDDGRDMDCETNLWDFSLTDVRISECASVNQSDFLKAHENVGQLQVMRQYQTQPYIYRSQPLLLGALGHVFALSASTPRYLHRVGLLKNNGIDDKARIKNLFLIALEEIVLLPYVYTMEKHRLALLRGEIDKSKWNFKLWELREKYSGIKPTVKRTENDFGAIAPNYLINNLVSIIIRFQLYRSACIKADQYNRSNPALPLDNCDIYESKKAGEDFRKIMSLGDSKPWPDIMADFTGERTLNGTAIADYFQPLHDWLVNENTEKNVTIGWD